MNSKFHFTFGNIKKQYKSAIDAGYNVITCEEYCLSKTKLANKTLVNRVDIDLSVKKTERLVDIFNELNIKASFF